MGLTLKQEEALKIAVNRYKTKERYTVIAGYAGSGKTFVARSIIDALNVQEHELLIGTFTGKAAARLQEGGFPQARTLHRLFYKTVMNPYTGEFEHFPKTKNDFKNYKIILIDEVSMVPDYMMKTIAKMGIHVIALGDPFQLPPIGKDNGLLSSPHIFLDEIVRQARESGIIRLSQKIREGEPFLFENTDDVILVQKEDLSIGMLTWADQVLCGTNNVRQLYNQEIRKELGFAGATPQTGEKIIFTKNQWDVLNKSGNPIINGLIGKVHYTNGEISKQNKFNKPRAIGRLTVNPDFGEGLFEDILYDALPFLTGETSVIPSQEQKKLKLSQLDFGYVTTVHKYQGSEAPKILGIDEVLRGTNRLKWLYTMVTRPQEKLVLAVDKLNPVIKLK